MEETQIDRMWVCVVRFRPWDKEEHDVVFKEVDIVKAEATPIELRSH